MRSSRSLPAIVGGLALVAVSLPALAAPAAAGPASGLTVFLQPRDPASLTSLAASPVTDRSARIAALERALPSAAARRQAIDSLRARGLSVTSQTAWSVTASGPSSLVSGLIGTTLGLPSLISGVLGTDGPAVVKPRSLAGGDFRRAYTSAANTAAGIAPYSGRSRVHKLTIATIQFSGWNSADLKTYAHQHGLPYSSSTLTQVPVAQSSVPTTSDGDGAIEVALDQESILSTDPSAHQRAYFAPNNDAGFANTFAAVLDDAIGNKSAYKGGDAHIGALSVSWGGCEDDSADQLRTVVNPILKSLVAAGVTVFASSGDSGAYDCTDPLLGLTHTQGVDFPASSPYVVGVGGTTLSSSKRAANSGHNWNESAWSCTDSSDCAGGLIAILGSGNGGTGGGVSDVFARPSYQSGVSAGGRAVPDISADANPETGFQLYSSQEGGTVQVGGTSLSSPVSAALFTTMLAAHGLSHGIGDIHAKLYAAAKHAGTFRDITSGTNGQYDAGPGYDEVTGLGAPLWPALGQRFFAGGAPRATGSIKRLHPSTSAWRRVTVSWGGRARSGRSLLTAAVSVSTGGTVVANHDGAAPRNSFTFTGKAGHTYRLSVRVVDSRHVMSAPFTVKLTVPRHR